MDETQDRLRQLRDKGWTLAAVADEVGVTPRAVSNWQSGDHGAQNIKAVLALLDTLLKRKRVPKQRRYAPGSRQRVK